MTCSRHKKSKSRKSNGGFSLIEMLIATAIFGSIAAGMATFLVRQQSAQAYIGARNQAMLTARTISLDTKARKASS
jgi:prepilin-type N-terminal cleavage/methylation domain-containing protein